MDLLKQPNDTPTLEEFTTPCLLFGERPSTVLERVMQTLEQQGLSPALSDTEAIRLAHEEAMKEPMDLDALADHIAAHPEDYDLAANDDPNKENELTTPRE